MALEDWYIVSDNTDGTVVTQTTYDGTHCLDFSPGISGSNYNGKYIFYPSNTSSSIIDEGLVSWAMENTASSAKFGAVIRSTSISLTGNGYFVYVDTSFLPHGRSLEIHRGPLLGNSVSTLQTATFISGGVSGSWYEYQVDFGITGGDFHIDFYTNEGTKDDPDWILQLAWYDTAPLVTAGYTGFLYKNENQNYVQQVVGTGLNTPVCVAYDEGTNQYIIADFGTATIKHMDAFYPYSVTTGVTDVYNMRSMCALSGFMWVKCSDTIYKYNALTKGITAVASTSGTNTDGDICTDGVDLYMTNMNTDGRIIKMLGSDPYTFSDVAGHTHTPEDDADGTGTGAVLREPSGITYYDGNFYFIGNHNGKLRKMVKSSSVVTTLAGGGQFSNDELACLSGGYFTSPITVTVLDNYRILVGGNEKKLKLYDLGTTMVSTLSGNGGSTNTDQAGLSGSFGIPFYSKGINPADPCVFFPSYDGDTVWRHPINFQTEVVFGSGYPASNAASQITADTGRLAVIFNAWRGMRYCDGYLYYIDNTDSTLLKIDVKTWTSSVIAGSPGYSGHVDATGTSARFYQPQGVSVRDGAAYIAEYQYLRKYNMSTGAVSTLITRASLTCISVLVTNTYIYTGWRDGTIQRTNLTGGSMTKVAGVGDASELITDNTVGISAYMTWPNFSNDSWDSTNNVLYFADDCCIRKIELSGDYPVTTIAGSTTFGNNGYVDATGSSARFGWPEDLVLDNSKENLLVLDTYNYRIREVALSDNNVTTYTSQSLNKDYDTNYQVSAGWRNNMHLYMPRALTIAGNHLYINVFGNILRTTMDSSSDINVDFLKIKKYND